MYIFIHVLTEDEYYTDTPNASFAKTKLRLEKASGERCLIAPFEEVNMRVINELKPRAVLVSGIGRKMKTFDVSSFYGLDEIYHEADLPILGFCGGHQMIGYCFNKNLRQTERLYAEPMKELDHATGGPYHSHEPGVYTFSASGFYPIKKLKNDPLFKDLPETMVMCCSHHCEIKKLPDGFEILAESEHCGIEAIKHKTRPFYGTQFHPEAYAEPFMDGRKLLENFVKIVDDFWSGKNK